MVLSEGERYNNNSGYGENTPWEMRALWKCFPEAQKIEKIDDIELQRQGVDYKVYFSGNRFICVDCKMHLYASEVFVYECGDTRPVYKDYGWTNKNCHHLTDQLVWIIPAGNECFRYNFKDLINYQETEEFKNHKYAPDTKHYNGVTKNKYYRPDFIPFVKVENLFADNEVKPVVHIKKNCLDLDEYCN